MSQGRARGVVLKDATGLPARAAVPLGILIVAVAAIAAAYAAFVVVRPALDATVPVHGIVHRITVVENDGAPEKAKIVLETVDGFPRFSLYFGSGRAWPDLEAIRPGASLTVRAAPARRGGDLVRAWQIARGDSIVVPYREVLACARRGRDAVILVSSLVALAGVALVSAGRRPGSAGNQASASSTTAIDE